ncbi:MAG: hypothetical protein FWD28_08690 [Treponema sp.]|nr:hypothetical protein [Treponema sp.]
MKKNSLILVALLIIQPSLIFSQVLAFQNGEYALAGRNLRMTFSGSQSGSVRLDWMESASNRIRQADGNWSLRRNSNGHVTTLVIIWTSEPQGSSWHRGRTDVYNITGEGTFEGVGRIGNSNGIFESWINLNPRSSSIRPAVTIPSWAQGTWYLNGRPHLLITSSQLVAYNGLIAECIRIDGGTLWFDSNNLGLYQTVTRTNSVNLIHYGIINIDNRSWTFLPLEKR